MSSLIDHVAFDETFFQARLKINRANRHINEAQQWFKAYVESDFCDFVADRDFRPGYQTLRVVAKPVPPDLVLAIGDAFHCMNCAMDYIMSGLMRAKTGSSRRISFPTHETRKALRKSFMASEPAEATPSNRRIVEAFPALACQFLTIIKPYKGGDFALWEIRKADNIDKHNLIIPSVTVAEIKNLSAIDEVYNNTMTGANVTVGAGGVVNMIAARGGQYKITNKGQPTARITFPETAEVFAGDPVFPTLLKCVQLVNEAANKIELVARRYVAVIDGNSDVQEQSPGATTTQIGVVRSKPERRDQSRIARTLFDIIPLPMVGLWCEGRARCKLLRLCHPRLNIRDCCARADRPRGRSKIPRALRKQRVETRSASSLSCLRPSNAGFVADRAPAANIVRG